jgi:Ca2+-binding EF-hand superfamily protein
MAAALPRMPLEEQLKQTNFTRLELETLSTKFTELAQPQNDKIDRARFRDILADTFGIDDSLLMDRGMCF